MSDKNYYVNSYLDHMPHLPSPTSPPFTLLIQGSKSLYHFDAHYTTHSFIEFDALGPAISSAYVIRP